VKYDLVLGLGGCHGNYNIFIMVFKVWQQLLQASFLLVEVRNQ
jgi:hypothetical protein